MRVDDFDYDLPAELIAQAPLYPREAAKLLHVPADPGQSFGDLSFGQIARLFRPGDLLVLNRSRVIPARLFGQRARGESIAQIETTLTEDRQGDLGPGVWTSFSKPGKRIQVGDRIDYSDQLSAQVLAKDGPEVTLGFNRSGSDLVSALEACGSMPLPPYIKRERGGDAADLRDYQPFSAAEPGSVAAATASLHFDQAAIDALVDQCGIQLAQVTLHVGLGTFAPIRVQDTDQHVMHFEQCAIDAQNAQRIAQTRAAGGRVIALGTTVLRTLESLAQPILAGQAAAKRTDLFIRPGYDFQLADALITNFHLPKSTLFMLVCAFAGTDRMKAAYAHAVQQHYRFFSYGDGSFLERASRA